MMKTKEELELEVKITKEIGDELLSRGASSIRGVLSRRLYALKLEIAALDLPGAQNEAVEG